MSKPAPALGHIELDRLRRAAGHEPPAVEPAKEGSGNPHYRVGRSKKMAVTVFWLPAVKDQLRMLGARRRLTIQAQLTEAINDYFAKHREPEIAE